MGYYTELKVVFWLKKDTPKQVIDLLKRVIIDQDLGHDKTLFGSEDVFKPDIDHSFSKCNNWYMLFLGTNFDDDKGREMHEVSGRWLVKIHSDFKNYGNEIDEFIDWISPYIAGRKKKQFIGYWKGEYSPQINIYIER